jgi:hypothetical protein
MSQPNAVVQESQSLVEFLPGTPGGKPGIRFRGTDKGFQLNDDGSISVVGTGMQGIGAPDGTTSLPGMFFTSQPSTGFSKGANGVIASGAGVGVAFFGNDGAGKGIINIYTTGRLSFSSAAPATGANSDLDIFRDAADTWAQRRGTNAQTFRIYNTFTDAANYERATFGWAVANVLEIGTEALGTGSGRNIRIKSAGNAVTFSTAGSDRYSFTSAGLIFTTDSANDIGAVGATRPRTIYTIRAVQASVAVTYSASMTPDAQLGGQHTITVTNGTAFTINAPSNPATGQWIAIIIRNTSGGAAGVATWNAVFKMAAWVQPATGFSRAIEFMYDGTNWIEVGRTTTDVPN